MSEDEGSIPDANGGGEDHADSQTQAQLPLVTSAPKPEQDDINKLIMKAVYVSMGLGTVYIPFFNLATVTATQVVMLQKIAKRYGLTFTDDIIKNIITSVAGPAVSTVASGALYKVTSLIPFIGLPLTVATRPVTNGVTTYALGHMFNCYCREGHKDYIGANYAAMRDMFNRFRAKAGNNIGKIIGGNADPELAPQ